MVYVFGWLGRILMKILKRLNVIKAASLPPVPKNSKELLKYYKDGMNFFYKELVTDNKIHVSMRPMQNIAAADNRR